MLPRRKTAFRTQPWFSVHQKTTTMAPPLVFFFVLSFLLAVGKPDDLQSEKAALLALSAAVGGSLPWRADATPCSWQGVGCSGGRVTTLRLPGSSLVGPLPPAALGNLTRLRTLSLRFNALSGPLPADIGGCAALRSLYLQGNRLSGQIPPALYSLRNLVRLDLSGNSLSGGLSPAANNLTRLASLLLQQNRLSGPLPSLRLPRLSRFNVSSNRLSGAVPASLSSFPAAAFSGNSLCGPPLAAACPGAAAPAPLPAAGANFKLHRNPSKKSLSGGAIAGIVIGSAVAFLILLAIGLIFCRRSSGPPARSVDIASVKPPEATAAAEPKSAATVAAAAEGGEKDMGTQMGKRLNFLGNYKGREFELEVLLRASAEVLGRGTFGTAYKAVLETGMVVAVKRLKEVSISEKEFRENIEAVGSMGHENLVALRAYYYSKDEKLLVYDYLPMGSLSALLHGNRGAGRTPLNWEIRSGIALGTARGVEYLHCQGPNISHGNIKSSNVLLTKNYGACVSDFGLLHLVGPSSTPNRVGGYRAPEVTDAHKVSQKADVYSFGVLLLELLTGKAPANSLLNEEGIDLPRWVQSVVREEWTAEVFDLELLRYQTVEDEMVQLLQLAVDCTAQYPDKRPSISEVVCRIEELQRSSLQQESGQTNHSIEESDDGSSRQTDSVEGLGQPPPQLFD